MERRGPPAWALHRLLCLASPVIVMDTRRRRALFCSAPTQNTYRPTTDASVIVVVVAGDAFSRIIVHEPRAVRPLSLQLSRRLLA